jgi:adenosylmethionine---8-amino-7-oxononanoate aminotransferase
MYDTQSHCWHPFSQEKVDSVISISRAKGIYLFDELGKMYIDAISSWWVNIHGHSHDYINSAIQSQVEKFEQVIFAGFTHQPAEQISKRLLSHLPEHLNRVFFSDDGSTSVEVALKMATQFWHNKGIDRKKIIAFKGAYHGDTLGAMSVGDPSSFITPFKHMLFDVHHIDPPTPGNEKKSQEQLDCFLKNNDVSAFIFEPLLQATAGMITHSAEALSSMIDKCHNSNVITIADEVMTGFGRTGTWFAIDQLKYKPDIVCISKGITGGYMAMGLTVCSERIYHAFYSDHRDQCFLHGHSYTANPIACNVALASMDLMEKKSTWDSIRMIKKKHHAIKNIFNDHKNVISVRHLGTMIAIECQSGNTTSYFNPIRDTLYNFFLDKGILLRPLGNIIYALPPYCITETELDIIYNSILDALDQVF